MIRDVELACDDLGDPPTSPKVVVIAGLPWSGQKNLDKLTFLLRVQAGLSAGMWFGFQGIHASFLHSPPPPLHRRLRNAKDFQHLAIVPAFQD
jgi:hypothetical protein